MMNITYIWFCIYYVFVISYLSLSCTSSCFEHNYILNYYSRKVFTIFCYETLIYLIQNECIIDKHAVIYKINIVLLYNVLTQIDRDWDGERLFSIVIICLLLGFFFQRSIWYMPNILFYQIENSQPEGRNFVSV